jgi:hypothetical protein
VQGGAAHELDVVVALAQGAGRGLPDHGEGLGQQPVQGLAVGDPAPERVRLGAQLRVAELPEAVLEAVDGGRVGPQPRQDLLVSGPEDFLQE